MRHSGQQGRRDLDNCPSRISMNNYGSSLGSSVSCQALSATPASHVWPPPKKTFAPTLPQKGTTFCDNPKCITPAHGSRGTVYHTGELPRPKRTGTRRVSLCLVDVPGHPEHVGVILSEGVGRRVFAHPPPPGPGELVDLRMCWHLQYTSPASYQAFE